MRRFARRVRSTVEAVRTAFQKPSPRIDPALLGAVRRARAGADPEESYRVLDGQLRPRLLRYFRFRGASGSEAEDLVQNVLLRVYQGVRGLQDEEKFMAWLFVIARNVRTTAASSRSRAVDAVQPGDGRVESLPDPTFNAAPLYEEPTVTRVWFAVGELPPQQRQCLILRVREEMSYEQIAETLQLSAHTVRNHLAQAKKTLRRLLGTPEGEH